MKAGAGQLFPDLVRNARGQVAGDYSRNFKFSTCNTGPDFSVTGTPASASTTQGGSASYTVTATPANGGVVLVGPGARLAGDQLRGREVIPGTSPPVKGSRRPGSSTYWPRRLPRRRRSASFARRSIAKRRKAQRFALLQ